MTTEPQSRNALRLSLHSGPYSIPIHRIYHIAGYATLSGEPEDYFLGWLTFHGLQVPVFDLNRVVCDQPTPEHFGSRIILLDVAPDGPTQFLGLLASDVTDTVATNDPGTEPLDLDSYLPMLYTYIPTPPAAGI